jgi:hypothetical protein
MQFESTDRRVRAQARLSRKRTTTESNVTAFDGQHRVAAIVEHASKHHAFHADDHYVGSLRCRRDAMRALPSNSGTTLSNKHKEADTTLAC